MGQDYTDRPLGSNKLLMLIYLFRCIINTIIFFYWIELEIALPSLDTAILRKVDKISLHAFAFRSFLLDVKIKFKVYFFFKLH